MDIVFRLNLTCFNQTTTYKIVLSTKLTTFVINIFCANIGRSLQFSLDKFQHSMVENVSVVFILFLIPLPIKDQQIHQTQISLALQII